MKLGKNIRLIRLKAGLSQIEFARLLETSQPNIHRWEKDIVSPSIKSIIKMAKLLNVPTDSILLSPDERNTLNSSNTFLSKRLKSIEKLTYKDQETLFQIIDAFLKSKK